MYTPETVPASFKLFQSSHFRVTTYTSGNVVRPSIERSSRCLKVLLQWISIIHQNDPKVPSSSSPSFGSHSAEQINTFRSFGSTHSSSSSTAALSVSQSRAPRARLGVEYLRLTGFGKFDGTGHIHILSAIHRSMVL